MSDRIRIVDIAQELGVSSATVSNVIHGKTNKISDATVKRVQEASERARLAVTILQQLKRGDNVKTVVRLPVYLVERASTV